MLTVIDRVDGTQVGKFEPNVTAVHLTRRIYMAARVCFSGAQRDVFSCKMIARDSYVPEF